MDGSDGPHVNQPVLAVGEDIGVAELAVGEVVELYLHLVDLLDLDGERGELVRNIVERL